MYCVLDIESTGGPFGKESIMEIALFKFDGVEIVDQLISLVHPDREIQKYVSKITGITSKMLVRAPRFHEIAKRILELTEGAVLVGHNAEFDYRMLRQEFSRLGYPFEMQTLDTIPLAEKLIPGLTSYGLDRVCEELGIFRGQKHRAEGDARATLELLIMLLEKDQKKDISILNQSIQNNDPIKDKIQDLKRSVKANRGIFYLHNQKGELLYLATSDNIKGSLNKLFIAENDISKKIVEEVYSVEAISTGNWLVGQIKKIEEAQKAKPKYVKIAKPKFGFGLVEDTSENDKLLRLVSLDKKKSEPVLVETSSLKVGYRAIRMMRRSMNVEQKNSLLNLLKDFPQRAIFVGKGRSNAEKCAFIVEKQKLVAYYYFKLNGQIDDFDKLSKSQVPIEDKEILTHLLKLGIVSGEYKQFQKQEVKA